MHQNGMPSSRIKLLIAATLIGKKRSNGMCTVENKWTYSFAASQLTDSLTPFARVAETLSGLQQN